eukprot:COSAG05_NODE_226_length_13453_cov_12.522315_5_plen_572_part_00
MYGLLHTKVGGTHSVSLGVLKWVQNPHLSTYAKKYSEFRQKLQDLDSMPEADGPASWLHERQKLKTLFLAQSPAFHGRGATECISPQPSSSSVQAALSMELAPPALGRRSDFIEYSKNNHLCLAACCADTDHPLSRAGHMMTIIVYVLFHLSATALLRVVQAGSYPEHPVPAGTYLIGSTNCDNACACHKCDLDKAQYTLYNFLFVSLIATTVAQGGTAACLGCTCLLGKTGSCSNCLRRAGPLCASMGLIIGVLVTLLMLAIADTNTARVYEPVDCVDVEEDDGSGRVDTSSQHMRDSLCEFDWDYEGDNQPLDEYTTWNTELACMTMHITSHAAGPSLRTKKSCAIACCTPPGDNHPVPRGQPPGWNGPFRYLKGTKSILNPYYFDVTDVIVESITNVVMTELKWFVKAALLTFSPFFAFICCGKWTQQRDTLIEYTKLLREEVDSTGTREDSVVICLIAPTSADNRGPNTVEMVNEAPLRPPSVGPSVNTQPQQGSPMVSTPTDIAVVLERAGLQQFESALRELGCVDRADLEHIEQEDLVAAGMKKIESMRFLRYVAATSSTAHNVL